MATADLIVLSWAPYADDAWWVTKLGLTEGRSSDNTAPRLAGRYHGVRGRYA